MSVLLTPKLIRRDLITLPLTRSFTDMLSQSPKIKKIYIYKSKLLLLEWQPGGSTDVFSSKLQPVRIIFKTAEIIII